MFQHPDENLVDDVLPTDGTGDTILDGHCWFAGNNLWVPNYKPGEERDIDIRVIVSDNHNFLSSQSNINKGIKAFRKVDFVFSLAYYMKLDAQYANIVLPVTTRWERNSGNQYSMMSDRELLFASQAITGPLFEARGIANGDIIRVFNDEGRFLRPAAVVRTVMPGVIMVPHGAGARIDRETGIDIAGADNMLTDSTHSTTPHLNAWNSNLCQYEKYEGPLEVLPDYLMDPIVPIAE